MDCCLFGAISALLFTTALFYEGPPTRSGNLNLNQNPRAALVWIPAQICILAHLIHPQTAQMQVQFHPYKSWSRQLQFLGFEFSGEGCEVTQICMQECTHLKQLLPAGDSEHCTSIINSHSSNLGMWIAYYIQIPTSILLHQYPQKNYKFHKNNHLLSTSFPNSHAVPSAASGLILHTRIHPGSMGSKASDTRSVPPSTFKTASKTCSFGHPSPHTAAKPRAEQAQEPLSQILGNLQSRADPNRQLYSDCCHPDQCKLRKPCTGFCKLGGRAEMANLWDSEFTVCTRIEV